VKTIVYVGNAESSDVHVLRLDPQSGDLAPVAVAAIPGIVEPGSSTPMAVSPDRRLLYVGTRGEPMIAAAFAIDQATGALTHAASGPLADSMAYIALDATGRWLLGASYPGNRITVSAISPSGQVQPAHQVLPDMPRAHSVRLDAANRVALAPTLGNDSVARFTFDAATGRLTAATPPATKLKDGSGPRHFVYHPGGTLVYVLGETDAQVYAFDYDAASGQLREKQSASALPAGFAGKPAAADLHVTPDGRYLYASERRSSTLCALRVDPASGGLSVIGSVPTETQPRGFQIDPAGRYLLAVGQLSHGLTSYRIEPDSGQLTTLRSYPVGKSPNWVEIVDLP
jgi:6-phosphogluconolactonase